MDMFAGDSSRGLQIVLGPLRVANLLLPYHDYQLSRAHLPPAKKRSVECRPSQLVSAESCCSCHACVHKALLAFQAFSTE